MSSKLASTTRIDGDCAARESLQDPKEHKPNKHEDS